MRIELKHVIFLFPFNILLLSVLWIPVNHASVDSEVKKEEIPAWEKSKILSNMLTSAYNKKSKQKLKSFFSLWHDDSIPFSDDEIESFPNVVKETYKVFLEFYRPTKILQIANRRKGVDEVQKLKYYVIQNTVEIAISENLKEGRENIILKNSNVRLKLYNFRPLIKEYKKLLFLSEIYSDTLDSFFGQVKDPFFRSVLPKETDEQIKNKVEFINSIKYTRIAQGHWGGVNTITDPYVTFVNFNREFSDALIYFQLWNRGGIAVLKKVEDKWTLISAKLTWIK